MSDPIPSALDGIDADLGALRRAFQLGRRAADVGFDWPDITGVLDKIDEERDEVRSAVAGGEADAITAEIGDLLFSVVNLCRHVGVDPEVALGRTNVEFERRFRAVEAGLHADGKTIGDEDLLTLEARWQAAKRS